jgi:hypothetical protein
LQLLSRGERGAVLKSSYCDTFFSKLSADGTSLLYSTFLGGNNDDYAILDVAAACSSARQLSQPTGSTRLRCSLRFRPPLAHARLR